MSRAEKIRDASGRRFRGWAVVNFTRGKRVPSEDPDKLVAWEHVERQPEWCEVEVECVWRERRIAGKRYPSGLSIFARHPLTLSSFVHESQIHMGPCPPLLTAEEGENFRLPEEDWFLAQVEKLGSRWWLSARGAMERVATAYEELHPEHTPGKGWRLALPEEVEALVASRRQGLLRLESETEEADRLKIEGAARKSLERASGHRAMCEARERKATRATKKAREREAKAEKKLAKILLAAKKGG